MGGFNAQLESQLLIRHVTTDSFRTFTIVAENEVSTALRDVRLLTRGSHKMSRLVDSIYSIRQMISVPVTKISELPTDVVVIGLLFG